MRQQLVISTAGSNTIPPYVKHSPKQGTSNDSVTSPLVKPPSSSSTLANPKPPSFPMSVLNANYPPKGYQLPLEYDILTFPPLFKGGGEVNILILMGVGNTPMNLQSLCPFLPSSCPFFSLRTSRTLWTACLFFSTDFKDCAPLFFSTDFKDSKDCLPTFCTQKSLKSQKSVEK